VANVQSFILTSSRCASLERRLGPCLIMCAQSEYEAAVKEGRQRPYDDEILPPLDEVLREIDQAINRLKVREQEF
jgi:hypothetical protein